MLRACTGNYAVKVNVHNMIYLDVRDVIQQASPRGDVHVSVEMKSPWDGAL